MSDWIQIDDPTGRDCLCFLTIPCAPWCCSQIQWLQWLVDVHLVNVEHGGLRSQGFKPSNHV